MSTAMPSLIEDTEIATYIRFVQLYGGGDQGAFISELDRFHKVFVKSGRIVPISTFKALADLKLEPSEISPTP